jgi:hypothetical protein
MVDVQRLANLDPVDLLDQECERLEGFFGRLGDDGEPEWSRETRCVGWGPREVLAHLAGADTYHLAGIEDQLNPMLEEAGKAGVTGIDSFNLWQVTSRADRSAAEVLDEWRRLNRAMRAGFRALGSEGTVASMVGAYPARLQAFHVAIHTATHADDLGVPVDPAAVPGRLAWRLTVCEFGLDEAGWPVELERAPDANRVRLGDLEAVLTDQSLLEAVTARLPGHHPLPPEIREVIQVLA